VLELLGMQKLKLGRSIQNLSLQQCAHKYTIALSGSCLLDGINTVYIYQLPVWTTAKKVPTTVLPESQNKGAVN